MHIPAFFTPASSSVVRSLCAVTLLAFAFGGCSSEDTGAMGAAGTTGLAGAAGAAGTAGAAGMGGNAGTGGAAAGAAGSNAGMGGANVGGNGGSGGAAAGSAGMAAGAGAGGASAGAGGASAGAGGAVEPGEFTLTSPTLMDGGTYEEPMYTNCGGDGNASPEMSWGPAPEGTLSYAVVLHDTQGFTHWAMWNIPATTTSLPEAFGTDIPDGAMQLAFQGNGTWLGPCPGGAGDPMRTYELTVYALSTATFDPGDGNVQTVRAAIVDADEVLASSTITASSTAQ